MARRVAVHTISLTIGALYLLLVLGAPFCAMSRPNHHAGHGTHQNASVCSWAHGACDSTLFPSSEFQTSALYSAPLFFITVGAAALEFDFQVHPARSPPIFLS